MTELRIDIEKKTLKGLPHTGKVEFRRTHGKCRIAGYTLIELLLTLGIASVLLAMGIPSLITAVNNYQLTASANSAGWAVQATRYQAIMHGYPYELTFNTANNTYQVSNDSAWPGTTTFTNVGGAVPISGSPVVFSAPTTLQFKPNGTVSAVTGAMTFTVTYRGLTRTVTVSNYGSVTIH